MRFGLIIAVALLLGLCTGNIFAETISPKKAKEILLKAQKLQKTRSYTYETIKKHTFKHGKVMEFVIKQFQRLNADGTTYLRSICYEKSKDPSMANATIKNSAGHFKFTGMANGCTMKLDYNADVAAINRIYYNRKGKFTGVIGAYGKIPCYIITRKVFFNKNSNCKFYRQFVKRRTVNFKRSKTELQKTFRATFHAVRIYYIGIKDMFIYKTMGYDPDGKLNFTEEFKPETLNLHPTISDNIFSLTSKEAENIVVAYSHTERMQIYNKILNQQGIIIKNRAKEKHKPSLATRTWNKIASVPSNIITSVDNNFSSITSILSTILFWGAMVLFGAVGFFKWRKKTGR